MGTITSIWPLVQQKHLKAILNHEVILSCAAAYLQVSAGGDGGDALQHPGVTAA